MHEILIHHFGEKFHDCQINKSRQVFPEYLSRTPFGEAAGPADLDACGPDPSDADAE